MDESDEQEEIETEDDEDVEENLEEEDVVDDEEMVTEQVPVVLLPPRQGVKRRVPNDSDEETVNHQPAPKRAAEVLQGSILQNLLKIREGIEQMVGQSMREIAQVLVRNEAALSTTVEGLRRALADVEGALDPSWEEFRIGLGPPQPQPHPDPGNSEAQPEITQRPLNEALAKEILRNLGRVFELYAVLMKRLGYGVGNVQEANDTNRVAYLISQVMNQLADMLQYTYRQKLHNVTKSLTSQCPKAKERIDTAIAKARAGEMNLSTGQVVFRSTPFLQVLPAVTFGAMEEPQIRYRISIPRDDLQTTPVELVQETNKSSNNEVLEHSITQREDNILVRYGTLEMINGTRTTAVNFNVHDINFHIYQTYISQGWVNPTVGDSPGQYVRALEFNLIKFKPGSIQHQIKTKTRSDKLASTEGQTQQIEISISGVIEGSYTTGSAVGQRVEFVFVLPPHLTVKHVNDVGVRDAVLKIQFAK